MKRLILMRHGKAERHAATGGDFERALAERGRDDAGGPKPPRPRHCSCHWRCFCTRLQPHHSFHAARPRRSSRLPPEPCRRAGDIPARP